jgi:hypothetical protein
MLKNSGLCGAISIHAITVDDCGTVKILPHAGFTDILD